MGFPMKMLDGVVGRLGEQGERDENDLRSGIIDQLEQSLTPDTASGYSFDKGKNSHS